MADASGVIAQLSLNGVVDTLGLYVVLALVIVLVIGAFCARAVDRSNERPQ